MTSAVSEPKLCTTCGSRYALDALFCPADGTPLVHAAAGPAGRQSEIGVDPYVGREISGHIQLRQLAGVGAMGRVYRAFQLGIERDVAVKILHRELSSNAQLVARFHREARVASRLSHPNVVQVHLAGQLPDGALYIVMEYLDGLSLQSALAAAGSAMPLPRTLHVALQLCDAAGEAHAQGVVHRDLKPENVMLVHRGNDPDFVKVLDFGIARFHWGEWHETSMQTTAGLIFGTARYISPEGAQGEAVGPAGDVYSIATLLFQMLSGRTPFEGEQAVNVLVQQIRDEPPPLREIARASYVPEPIARVVMKNLAKRPEARDQDARSFGRALLDAAKESGLSVEDLIPRSILLGARGPLQLPPLQRTKQLQLDRPLPEPPPSAPLSIPTPPPIVQLAVAAARSGNLGSNVDVTLDDLAAQPALTPAPRPATARAELPTERPHEPLDPGPPARTHPVLPVAAVLAHPARTASMPAPAPGWSDVPGLANDPRGSNPSYPSHPSYPSYPSHPSPPPEDAPVEGRPAPVGLRRAAIVVLCFLLGASATALVAAHEGLLPVPAGLGLERSGGVVSPSFSSGPVIAPLPESPAPGGQLEPIAPSHERGPERSERLEPPREVPRAKATAVMTAPKAEVEAQPNAPRVGQAVELIGSVRTSAPAPARAGERERREGAADRSEREATFRVGSPGAHPRGEGDAVLPAHPEADGTWRARFTFLAPGAYEIAFRANVTGEMVQATRMLTVAPPSGRAASPAATSEPPAPSSSVPSAAHAPPPTPSLAPSPAPSPMPSPAPSPAPSPEPSGSVRWM